MITSLNEGKANGKQIIADPGKVVSKELIANSNDEMFGKQTSRRRGNGSMEAKRKQRVIRRNLAPLAMV